MPLKRGVAVWISGFLTFLAAINVVNAVMLWRLEGPYSTINPYLIGNWIGNMQVSTYLWASITATFVFLGLTSVIAYRRLPPDPAIIRMLVKLGGHLAATKKTVETTQKDLYDGLENNKIARGRLFKKANENLENARQEMLEVLLKQEKTIQEVRKDALSAIETNLSSVREKLSGKLDKQARAVQKVEQLSKRNAKTVEKQTANLADIRSKLEKIEAELMPPQPMLTSQNDLEKMKGIGSGLGKELRSIGLTNIGELVATDPIAIAEKTRPSQKMVERFQQKALLLMIPGIEERDVRLLKEVGITTRRELADQDPILLSRRIEEVAKTYVEKEKISREEKPTIEEISSWIKNAKF